MKQSIDLKLFNSNRDINPSELDMSLYTAAHNIKFADGRAEKVTGYTQYANPISIAPLKLHSFLSPTTSYWMYAGLAAIYVTDGTTNTDITPTAGITTTLANRWNKTSLNGVPVFNNKVDDLIYWNGATGTPMADVPGWTSGDACDVIRSHKNFLIALAVTQGGVRSGNKLIWSVSADAGGLPSTFVPAADNDAGDKVFSETPDDLIDGMTLGDMFIVYKQNSCHIMRYTGDEYIFDFEELFSHFGALAEGCVAEVDDQHVVLTTNDLIIHNGNTFDSVIDEKYKTWLFNQINNDYLDTCYLVNNVNTNELWVCFPSGSSTIPNMKLVWNYREDTLHVEELAESYDTGKGVVEPTTIAANWDGDSQAWEDDTTNWDEKLYSKTNESLLIAGYTDTLLYHVDSSETRNGTVFQSYVEKTTIPLINRSDLKLVDEIWPNIQGDLGASINIRIGTQNKTTDPISWSANMPFIIGTDDKVDCYAKGRFISIRYEAQISNNWSVGMVTLNAKLCGKR